MPKNFADIPGPIPENQNWFENTKALAASSLTYIESLRKQYGNIIAITRHHCTTLSITNCPGTIIALGPDCNKTILMDVQSFRPASPEEIRHVSTAASYALSYSLRTHNIEQHKKSRKLFTPSFSTKNVESYYTDIAECASRLLSTWQNEQIISIEQEMKTLCLDINNRVSFGQQNPGPGFSEAFYHLLDIRRQRDLSKDPKEKERLMTFFLEEAERITTELRIFIKEIRQKKSGSGIFASLALLQNNGEFIVSEEELIGTANSLTLSSVDTITAALSWTLFLIGVFPDWEEKLLKEITPCKTEKLSSSEIQSLPTLDHILKESLRLLPPSALLLRKTAQEVLLGEYLLPAKTEILFSPYITHRLPEIFSHPNQFQPARWETAHPTIFEYLPFSTGPKSCLGENLAISEMKIVLITLLKQYRFKFLLDNVVNWRVNVILGLQNPIYFQLVPMAIPKSVDKKNPVQVRGTINELIDFSNSYHI